MLRPFHRLSAGVLVLLTACGGGGGSSSAPSSTPSGGSPAPQPAAQTDVLTARNDAARTGQNLTESVLTPTNVASGSFGLLRTLPVDGKVDAQPLYVSHLSVAGGVHDTVIAATEHDSVYAFDAATGSQLWRVSLLANGETPSDSRGCYQIEPEIGITATPVIDRKVGAHGAIYLVAMSHGGGSKAARFALFLPQCDSRHRWCHRGHRRYLVRTGTGGIQSHLSSMAEAPGG